MRLPDPPLLLVTDRRQARRPLAEVVGAALAAGCRWVSLREKDLPEDEQVPLARSLLPLVRRHGARLMVHGEATLAKLAGADGVHLPSGQRSNCRTRVAWPGKTPRSVDPYRHRGRSDRSRRSSTMPSQAPPSRP